MSDKEGDIIIVDTCTNTSNFTLFNFINDLSSKCKDIKTNISSSIGKPYENVTVQEMSSCKKTSLNKQKICQDLRSLLNVAEYVCNDVNISPVVDHINLAPKVDDDILSTVNKSFKKHTEFIEKQFADLKLIVDRQKSTLTAPEPSMVPLDNITFKSNANVICTPEPPVAETIDDFLTEDEGSQLYKYLSTVDYKRENGHSVKNFGAAYRYTGAGDKNPVDCEIPAEIQCIIDNVSKLDNYKGLYINECLVNRYEGAQSFLPPHSDDELCINPESSIFSLSIGKERNVIFRDKFSGNETNHVAQGRSMYVMTRTSQTYYSHRIDKLVSPDTKIRYSLVFRHVEKRFQNSTVIIGDSNTKDFKFAEGKGNFGKSLPGKRIQASHVEHINPFDCAAYAHVVIIAGTNDLRSQYVSNTGDIDKVVQCLADKISMIEKIRKDIKIRLMPVLPTRYSDMNRHIMYYNRKVLSRFILSGTNFNISMPNVCQFLDQDGLLRTELTRTGDAIHLNERGLAMFACNVKYSILPFPRKVGKGPRKSKQGSSIGHGVRDSP